MRNHRGASHVRCGVGRRLVGGFRLYVALCRGAVLFGYLRDTRQALRLHPGGARPALTVSFVQQTLGHLTLALGNSETRQPLQPLWDQANHLAVPVPVGITIACAVLWALGRKRRRSEMPVGLVAQRIQTFVPYTTIAVAVAVIMRSVALLGYANPAVHISRARPGYG